MGRKFAYRLLLKKLNLVHKDYITVLLRIMYLGRGRKPSLGPLIWLGNFGVLDKWSFLGSGGTWRFDCNYTSLLSGFLSHRHGTVKPPLMVTSTMATSLSSVSKVAIEERFNCITETCQSCLWVSNIKSIMAQQWSVSNQFCIQTATVKLLETGLKKEVSTWLPKGNAFNI